MKQLFILPVLLLTLLLGNPASALAQAPLRSLVTPVTGSDAYDKGDYATALREWKPLAEQGNALAQSLLALLYYNGQGVTKNYKTAFMWYTLAAEQGNADAQNNLGVMYEKGQGTKKNYVLSYMWYSVAVSQWKFKDLKKNRDNIEVKMSSTQIDTAQKFAQQCVKKNYKGCGKSWWKFW